MISLFKKWLRAMNLFATTIGTDRTDCHMMCVQIYQIKIIYVACSPVVGGGGAVVGLVGGLSFGGG